MKRNKETEFGKVIRPARDGSIHQEDIKWLMMVGIMSSQNDQAFEKRSRRPENNYLGIPVEYTGDVGTCDFCGISCPVPPAHVKGTCRACRQYLAKHNHY